MQIGIDSFAANPDHGDAVQAMGLLLERIEWADQMGLDVFGIGEHYRKEFLDSAPSTILAAAAAKTNRIRLSSAVTVLSTSDPVRVFQNFSSIDLISDGRAEIVVGRGSFVDSFPLFGYNLNNYDEIFAEKLELLLKIQKEENVSWSGLYRPPLREQSIFPRPKQKLLPIWLGVGGTPASFARAGQLGLPLMVAVIGGETHRFSSLVDMYRTTGQKHGFSPEQLKVGLHSFGFVAPSKKEAIDAFYPGYARVLNSMNKERGWVAPTRAQFEKMVDEKSAIVIGDPEEVAQKIIRHSKALGGISRFTFQMDVGLSHEQLKQCIELIGKEVKPRVLKEL